MSVIVLIPAAGAGRRMGGITSKQYLRLCGKPILTHTVAMFDAHPRVDSIYVIAPANELDMCRDQCLTPYSFTKVRDIVRGGAQRQDSVRNGILACDAQGDDILIIHDGVRPLFPIGLLDKIIDETQKKGACIVGVPVKDTVKEVENGVITATPPREKLWAAHTPQAFRHELIRAAHLQAQQENYYGTDDASLLEWQGLSVSILEDSYCNIKITTPEDLLIAKALFDEYV